MLQKRKDSQTFLAKHPARLRLSQEHARTPLGSQHAIIVGERVHLFNASRRFIRRSRELVHGQITNGPQLRPLRQCYLKYIRVRFFLQYTCILPLKDPLWCLITAPLSSSADGKLFFRCSTWKLLLNK